MNRHHWLWVKCFIAFLLLGATSASAQVANEGRCGADQLTNNEQADARIDWAFRCGYINAQAAWSYKNYFDIASSSIKEKTSHTYPLFGWLSPKDQTLTFVWKAPIDRYADCPRPYEATLGGYPQAVGECVAGCYTPEQRLRFSGGEVAIRRAVETNRTDIVTLGMNATMEQLKFQVGKVAVYTVDITEAKQPIFNIRTASGGLLRVTPNHPIVDGSGVVKQAHEFVVGDELVRANGALDPVISIEKELFYGKAYNLKPTTFDPLTNIVVAEGFLNGSGRYQDKSVTEGNRSLLRKNIPDSAFAQ